MSETRKNQLGSLIIVVALAVIHYFWGKSILMFLATVVLYWVIAGLLALALGMIIVAIVKDQAIWTDTDYEEEDLKRKERNHYHADE